MTVRINRRTFCSTALTASFLAWNHGFSRPNLKRDYEYHAIVTQTLNLPVPEGHRVAFGMEYFTLDKGEGLLLQPPKLSKKFQGRILLRLQVAIDTRAMDEVEVLLAKSNRKIGHLSIWYPTGLQIFETLLDCDVKTLQEEGIRLRIANGDKPIYFLSTSPTNGSHFLAVHRIAIKPDWHQILCSERSLQPFSWLEGCVLDGLHELYVRKNDVLAYRTLNTHLDRYLVDDENLIYVDLWARPSDNVFNNLETGNNFAQIARYRPKHPSINLFLEFCKKRFDSTGKFLPDHLTQEGVYTLAYPLAVLGNQLKDHQLLKMSLTETEERVEHLLKNGSIYRMGSRTKGVNELDRNWTRGVVWFLLGLARTLEQLVEGPLKKEVRVSRLIEVFKESATLVLRYQQPDHSWKSFLDLNETFYETSGTAGLAAAMAIGHRMGWLPEFDQKRLALVNERLQKSMTPDGFLKHTTQHNAGSYKLMQMGEYRVISQYTLGFVGIINAHIDANRN